MAEVSQHTVWSNITYETSSKQLGTLQHCLNDEF